MSRKPKPRKPIASPDASPEGVWLAPRPGATPPKRIEPVSTVKSNRYLDFADIAFGAKKPSSPKKKNDGTPFRGLLNDEHDQKQQQLEQESAGKVTPINSRKSSKAGGPKKEFGAFRNPR